ncbi:phage family protein, partial [Vibrio parahaemolyticus V-223/04]
SLKRETFYRIRICNRIQHKRP